MEKGKVEVKREMERELVSLKERNKGGRKEAKMVR